MKLRKIVWIGAILALVAVLALYPLDTYISRPGGAYDLEPLVEVAGGDQDDEGTFSLMTISIGKATPLMYAYSRFSNYMKVMPASKVRRHGETDEEYSIRQKRMMKDSQTNAITVAFDRAGLPVTKQFKGIYVLGVMKNSAASGKLEVGDRIVEVDQKPLSGADDFVKAVSGKDAGEELQLKVIRKKTEYNLPIKLQEIPDSEHRVGLGIQFEEDYVIETDPHVEIKTADIGGPSAGLMFTLEIMNRLLDEDVTKGYDVAGTGEIFADGTVGRIGGIDFKVVAADRQGIDIFFAPDDELPAEVKKKNPHVVSNYEEAKRTAEEIGTTMKVVPVKTVDDALNYLKKLEAK